MKMNSIEIHMNEVGEIVLKQDDDIVAITADQADFVCQYIMATASEIEKQA